MKILVHQNFIPHYRRRLFEALCGAEDLEITIASDDRADSAGIALVELHTASFRWERCKTTRIGNRLFVHFGLPRVIRRLNPSAVIAMGNPNVLSTWILLLWGRLMNVPILLWTHGLLKQETGLKGAIRRTFYRLASGLLLYGDHAKTLLIQAGFDPKGLFVVYNSLDFEKQQEVSSRVTDVDLMRLCNGLGVCAGDRIVVFSGRLQENKKLHLLIEAAGILKYRGRKVHILFIGDGEEKTRLVEQSARCGIESQVHFLGETYDESFIATAYIASDLSVVPSGAGLSVMHALGYGVPVLLHDRPWHNFPEWEAVLEGETGFFYRFDDAGDMADKIEAALFPVSRKDAMKKACLAMIENRYNAGAQANAILAAVRQVV